MGKAKEPRAVRLFCGLIAGSERLLSDAVAALAEPFGPVLLRSSQVPFGFTDYYEREMGVGLLRQLVAFAPAFDPGQLARAKLLTNELENRFIRMGADGVGRRQANLDPGYVTTASVVLATTKNFAHRVYLSHGIYAELTLTFRRGAWQSFEWTYPDYRTDMAWAFFDEVRRELIAATQPGQASG